LPLDDAANYNLFTLANFGRFGLRLLYAVLAVSLVFGGGSAPRTGALCFQPLAQR
jgi:hypothetical protein